MPLARSSSAPGTCWALWVASTRGQGPGTERPRPRDRRRPEVLAAGSEIVLLAYLGGSGDEAEEEGEGELEHHTFCGHGEWVGMVRVRERERGAARAEAAARELAFIHTATSRRRPRGLMRACAGRWTVQPFRARTGHAARAGTSIEPTLRRRARDRDNHGPRCGLVRTPGSKARAERMGMGTRGRGLRLAGTRQLSVLARPGCVTAASAASVGACVGPRDAKVGRTFLSQSEQKVEDVKRAFDKKGSRKEVKVTPVHSIA